MDRDKFENVVREGWGSVLEKRDAQDDVEVDAYSEFSFNKVFIRFLRKFRKVFLKGVDVGGNLLWRAIRTLVWLVLSWYFVVVAIIVTLYYLIKSNV